MTATADPIEGMFHPLKEPTATPLSPEEEKQLHTALREADKTADDLAEVDPHPDRTRENRTPGFSRMRTSWTGDDAMHVQSLRAIVDDVILTQFPDATLIMNDLYEIVRQPKVDESTGEVITDRHGFPVWQRNDSGAFIEDYGRLTYRDREDLLFRITTNLVRWREVQANLWGDAMFAKAAWEERFSSKFLSAPGMRPTVDDKNNAGRAGSTEERYFAIFQTLISRRADAMVDGMTLLGQRLKDVIEK